MTDLSRKSVLFYDASGSYTAMAEAVVGDFSRIGYYCPWERAFPMTIDALPGLGLDGVDRVMDFYSALDGTDLVVFCDVGNGGLQEDLRSRGMPVFGSGSACQLEQDRVLLKSLCKKLGIKAAEYVPIRGIDNLREMLLATEDEAYVKVSYFRGLAETFHHTGPFATKAWLDDISLRAGPYGAFTDFVVEQPIAGNPCVEIGFDTYSADGLYPDLIAYGYEAKDAAFVLNTRPLPPRLKQIAEKLQPALKDYKYRGPLSIEARCVPQGDYFVDFTARFPEPPSSLQRFMIRNWAEIMYETANGRIVEPDYVATFGVEIVMKSAWAAEHPLAVQIARPDRTTLHGHCVIEGQDYATSPAELEEFGAACGYGNSLADAVEDALDAAEGIHGFQVGYDKGALDELMETIQEGNKLKLSW